MNLTINTEQLRTALRTCAGSINRYSTLEVLSHVLLSAKDDCIYLTTTNLDTTVCCSVPCTIAEHGSVTVPHKRLLDLLLAVEKDEITLTAKDRLEITAESVVALNGLDPDEFPPAPKLDDACSFEISQPVLKQLLTQTAFCMSTDESRYVLNGVYMVLKEKELVAVGTDGRRISIVKAEASGPSFNMILPAATVRQLIPLLDKDPMLNIEVGKNHQARFTTESVILTSKTIDGNFPNYQQVIPDNQVQVVMPRTDLLRAASRASVLTTEKTAYIKLHFTKHNLAVSVGSDVGQSRENIPINYTGHELNIALAAHYLLEVLNVIPDGEMRLELPNELEPIIIKSDSLLHVLMPVRTT